jgi:hypothetical protein
MTERIIERIGRKINNDVLGWYQAKVNEMAHFIVKKIKEDTAALKRIESNKHEELEVSVK